MRSAPSGISTLKTLVDGFDVVKVCHRHLRVLFPRAIADSLALNVDEHPQFLLDEDAFPMADVTLPAVDEEFDILADLSTDSGPLAPDGAIFTAKESTVDGISDLMRMYEIRGDSDDRCHL